MIPSMMPILMLMMWDHGLVGDTQPSSGPVSGAFTPALALSTGII